MATLTIRDLDDALKLKLRLRAASRNRSMEEEARQILRTALTEIPASRGGFVARIKSRFEGLGDVVLPVEPREAIRRPLEIREPISRFDAQIAAIALQRGMALATRNTRDFEGCGLQLIDPWSGQA